MSKKDICLITGGAGFIGCAISGWLRTEFERVIAFDNLHPQVHSRPARPALLDEGVELVVGDVSNADHWRDLLGDAPPSTVIHLAAETGTGQSLTEGSRHAHTNLVGLTRMLDAFVKAKTIPDKILLTSSRAVYGEGAWRRRDTGAVTYPGPRTLEQLERADWDFPGLDPLPFGANTTEPRPTSIYGATKLAQEHIVNAWSLAFGVKPIILRLQNVYGPGQSLSNPYTGIVSLFCRLARSGASIPVYEDGQMLRDFVFIDDVVDAIGIVLKAFDPTPLPFDIGSGSSHSIAEVAAWIAARYGAPPPHVNGAYRHGDIRHASCDITQTTARLNWSPRWSLDDGLEHLCRWIDRELAANA